MSTTTVSDQTLTNQGPITLPDEISPTVYIRPFFEWLQSKEENVLHEVRLRLVWLHAKSFDEDGIVNYGEIDGGTMKLGMTADLKKFLKGTAAYYSSDERWFKSASSGVSGIPLPFDPDKQSQVEVTIWTGSGQVDLDFTPKQVSWTIVPKYAAGSNLLYGFPSGAGAPIVKPMVMLSLSKHSVATGVVR